MEFSVGKKWKMLFQSDWSVSSADSVKIIIRWNVMSDIHGNSDYRANLVNIMALRAVEKITNEL